MQRVSFTPDGICSGQGDTGKVLRNLISFICLRCYTTLATEDIVK